MIRMSGRMALSVIAVSISVSPFFTEDEATDMFMTSAPSRLPASSNDDCVRVEASKNRLICVRPRSDDVFLSGRREIATAASARSSKQFDVGTGKIADAEQMAVRVERRKGGVGHLKALL